MELVGIVIDLIPIKEEDAMVRLISHDGIVSFFGRRIMNQKNSYYAPMQPFAKSHVWLTEGPQGGLRLKQARLESYTATNYQSLDQYALLALIKETLAQLAPTDDYRTLYILVETILEAAQTARIATFAALIYLHQLLNVLGWGLELSGCVSCETKTDIVGLDLPFGGFVCRKHYRPIDSLALSRDQLTLLAALKSVDLKHLTTHQFENDSIHSILTIMAKHYENMTGHPLKSLKLFR